MSLKEEIEKLSTDWREILSKLIDENPQIEKEYIKNEELFSESLPTYPKKENIFRCFNYVDPKNVSVVILGQDPYHGLGQAIGLSFGVNEGDTIPPSLRNIFKKLDNVQTTSTLELWAEQGVLMLNAALTVRHKTPAAHMKWWLPFTKGVIKYLKDNYEGKIFVAWGAFAHRLLEDVGDRHHLLVSSHPSPFSYFRNYREFPAFKDTEPFKEINTILTNPIKW